MPKLATFTPGRHVNPPRQRGTGEQPDAHRYERGGSNQVADDVLERLQRRLAGAGVAFDLLRHEPVYTSQQAAVARGTSLSSGAKALVCKADDHFDLFVLPA